VTRLDRLDRSIKGHLLGAEAGKPEWYQPGAAEVENLLGEALVAQDWDFLEAVPGRLRPVIKWWWDAEAQFDHEREAGVWMGRNNVVVSALVAAGLLKP
jgi:hypothetical protein